MNSSAIVVRIRKLKRDVETFVRYEQILDIISIGIFICVALAKAGLVVGPLCPSGLRPSATI